MIAAHKRFDNEIWFAGGAWTWAGFASGNKLAIETIKLELMNRSKQKGLEKIYGKSKRKI